jgi:peptide-methionine (S)-S-oxide reductase
MGKLEKATFGAGCFWGVEEKFRKMKGVKGTAVGYMGGERENPSYEDVCTGKTGHAEVVQLEYDPDEVSYEELLDAFWKMHDPGSLNRQGLDFGEQYRSVIFFHNGNQKEIAEGSKRRLVGEGRKIVTEISPAKEFWKAEEYHQRYIEKKKGR